MLFLRCHVVLFVGWAAFGCNAGWIGPNDLPDDDASVPGQSGGDDEQADPDRDPNTGGDGDATGSGGGGDVGGGGEPDPVDSGGRGLGLSPGCGTSNSGSGDFEEQRLTLQGGGGERTYWLLVPHSYDPDRAYPAVFRFHGAGGDGLSGGLDIQYQSQEDAIIVAGDGPGHAWRRSEVDFFDQMLEITSSEYCLDMNRIFIYGFSSGGGMTNYLACARGDVVRAAVTLSGWDWGDNCAGHASVMLIHGLNDDVVFFDDNAVPVRDRFRIVNGCSDVLADDAIDRDCQAYQGCDDEHQVVWCPGDYAHDIQGDRGPEMAWEFFERFQ